VKTRKWMMLFILVFSIVSVAAQAPVTDLVIYIGSNSNDVQLEWSRPPEADFFRIYAGPTPNSPINETTQIGETADISFTHVNGLAAAEQQFYSVVAVSFGVLSNMTLIPAGPFEMGAEYIGGAVPVHTVNVPAYYIDIFEVTNAQYKTFCDSTNRAYPECDPEIPCDPFFDDYFTNPIYANYPVVNVDWNDARAYAGWAGKRLLSEAEWERAAKGNADNREWSWGDEWIPANANVSNNPEDSYDFTAPVGSYPYGASPDGCFDMIGNVAEWCRDDPADYSVTPTDGSAWIDPFSQEKIIRGRTYDAQDPVARCAKRNSTLLSARECDLGFRCALTSDDANLPPDSPADPSPANNAVDQPNHVVLTWACTDPESDPLTYDVYFGSSSLMAEVRMGQTATTVDLGMHANNTTYYWRIVAIDSRDHSTWGPVWSFTTTNQPPDEPGDPMPADNESLAATELDLIWTCSDPEDDPLTFDVYLGSTTTPPLVNEGQIDMYYHQVELEVGLIYYWQIVAHDNHAHSTAGPVWSFTIIEGENEPPDPPNSPIPSNGAVNKSIYTDLHWRCHDNDYDPLTYDVFFGTASPPPQVSTGQTAAIYDPGVLLNSQTYYWKIIAYDNHSHSATGPVWSFTTAPTGCPAGLVLVPAGSYSMGAEYFAPTSMPIHTVDVPAFYLDTCEVTNTQYKTFCDATSRAYPPDPNFSGMSNYFTNPAYVNYPVVNVSWDDVSAYCAWTGKRLPTESEWERAAKGLADNRQWPWGDSWIAVNANSDNNPADGYTYTAPVGSYPGGISPVGCYDMAGNVFEWCEDDYHSSYSGAPSDGSAWIDFHRNSARILRGGGWAALGYEGSESIRCAVRGASLNTSMRLSVIGFRTAQDF
jgi:formylglycine-generating enzyme required for sulfatase activity